MTDLLQSGPGSDVWSRALGVLAHNGMTSVIILSLAGLVTLALRRRSAALRHMIWTLALVATLLAPAISLATPRWRFPVLPGTESLTTPDAGPRQDENPAARLAHPVPSQTSLDTFDSLANDQNNAITLGESGLGLTRFHPAQCILLLWSVGVFVLLVRIAAGTALASRLYTKSSPMEKGAAPVFLRPLADMLGVPGPVALRCTAHRTIPMAAGLIRPAIFLPLDAADWDNEKTRVVLLHELAHIKRRDCATHAAARLAAAFHWFNPLVWIALKRLCIEREHACDDLVLSTGERPWVYADYLLQIASADLATVFAAGAAVPMARAGRVERRLVAVLDASRNRSTVTRRGVVFLHTAALALLALVAPIELVAQNPQDIAQHPSVMIEAESGRDETTPPSAVVFANGARAIVLGVGEAGDDPMRPAWLPDGTPLDRVPGGYEKLGGSATPQANEMARELYTRIELAPHDTGAGITYRVNGCGSVSGGPTHTGNIVLLGIAACFRSDQTEAALELGIAAGPWKTLVDAPPRGGTGTGRFGVVFSDSYTKDGNTCVVVTHSVLDQDFRLVARDDAGGVYLSSRRTSIGITGAIQSEFQFHDIPPEKVAQLEFQAREYEWRTIPGIALQPDIKQGHATPPNLMTEPRSSTDGTVTLKGVCLAPGTDKTRVLILQAANHSPTTQYLGVDLYIGLPGFLGGASHLVEVFALEPGFSGELRRTFDMIMDPLYFMRRAQSVHIQVVRTTNGKIEDHRNRLFLPPDSEKLFDGNATLPCERRNSRTLHTSDQPSGAGQFVPDRLD